MHLPVISKFPKIFQALQYINSPVNKECNRYNESLQIVNFSSAILVFLVNLLVVATPFNFCL